MPRWAAFLREYFGPDALIDAVRVLRWYWWAGLALLALYVVSFNLSGRHYRDVTLVILGQTDRLRRSYYLRGLALGSQAAKDTRIFDLKHWLVAQYQDHSLAVLRDIWRKRDEGWLVACGIVAAIAAIEALTLGVLAMDTVGSGIALGTAMTVVHAILSAGMLSRYEDARYALAQAKSSLGSVLGVLRWSDRAHRRDVSSNAVRTRS